MVLEWGGLAIATGGLVYTTIRVADFSQPITDLDWGLGLGLMGVGSVAMVVNVVAVPPMIATPRQAQMIAEEHNYQH